MPKFIDLQGKKFGRLKALYIEVFNDRPGIHWNCKCDCGNFTSVEGGSLRSGHTKSCGCIQREFVAKQGKKNFKGENVATHNSIFLKYKRGAKNRNLEFSLTLEQLVVLIKDLCYYCGSNFKNNFKHSNISTGYKHNGIDRVDNSKGYVLENCVSCCKDCNKAKGTLDKDLFLDLVKKIYEKHYK